MNLTSDERSYILKKYLKTIFNVSDKNYQRRIWIRAEGPECGDFDEAVCRYWSLVESIFLEPEKYAISDIQLKKMKKFHEEFKGFSEENDLPQAFIDTPEWDRIV